MLDHELYRHSRNRSPWFVDAVDLKTEAGEIHAYLRHHEVIEWPCRNAPQRATRLLGKCSAGAAEEQRRKWAWPFSSRIFTLHRFEAQSSGFQKVLGCGANAAETNGGTLIGDGAAQLLDAWERNLLRMARRPPDIEDLSKRAASSIVLHSFLMPAGMPASNPAATALA